MAKSLGSGKRAKNGQYRRRSKFNPCVQCGMGTAFILCVSCAEKNKAYATHTKARTIDLADNHVTEERAEQRFNQLMMEGF